MPKRGEKLAALKVGETVSSRVGKNASPRASDGIEYCDIRIPSSVASALDIHPGMTAIWSVWPDGTTSIRFTF